VLKEAESSAEDAHNEMNVWNFGLGVEGSQEFFRG
jgi:hypothetical protein